MTEDEKQQALEILGRAIGEIIPEARATGTATEHATSIAAQLRERVALVHASGLMIPDDAQLASIEQRCDEAEREHTRRADPSRIYDYSVRMPIGEVRALVAEIRRVRRLFGGG